MAQGASDEANVIDGERSNQIQIACGASHSRSRTKARSSRAERRQLTRAAGSPERKRAELPEGFARPGLPSPMDSVQQRMRDLGAATMRLGRRAASVDASWRMRRSESDAAIG